MRLGDNALREILRSGRKQKFLRKCLRENDAARGCVGLADMQENFTKRRNAASDAP